MYHLRSEVNPPNQTSKVLHKTHVEFGPYLLFADYRSGVLSQQTTASAVPAMAREALAPTSAHNAQPKHAAARALEDIYRKMTPLEHILARPDTYIGSIEKQDKILWVHTGEGMAERKIDFAPGLYKIFDEASYRSPHLAAAFQQASK